MVDEKELDLIEKAHIAAERIEKANAEYKELVKRSEAVESRRILGGQTAAGEAPVQPLTDEQKAALGAQTYFKGSIIEKALGKLQ